MTIWLVTKVPNPSANAASAASLSPLFSASSAAFADAGYSFMGREMTIMSNSSFNGLSTAMAACVSFSLMSCLLRSSLALMVSEVPVKLYAVRLSSRGIKSSFGSAFNAFSKLSLAVFKSFLASSSFPS